MKFKVFMYFGGKDRETAEQIKIIASSVDTSIFLYEPFLPNDDGSSFIEERSNLRMMDSDIIAVLSSKDLENSLSAQNGINFAQGKKPIIIIERERDASNPGALRGVNAVRVDMDNLTNDLSKVYDYLDRVGSLNENCLGASLNLILITREILMQRERKRRLLGVMYVKRKGGSLSIIIPKKIAQSLEIADNDILGIYYSEGEISLKKME